MPARVLIADDNPQNASLLEAYLEGDEFEVVVAADGEETLAQVRTFQPDVLLLDIMMPKLSGFEVCKRLKSDSTIRGLPILMITALDQPSDIERAVDAGADDFLTKPIHQTELVRRVRALIESRNAGGGLDRALSYIEAVDRGTP